MCNSCIWLYLDLLEYILHCIHIRYKQFVFGCDRSVFNPFEHKFFTQKVISRSIYNLKIDTIYMYDIPFDRSFLQLSNGIRHVMPSTERKLELTAKASMAQPVSQPAVCCSGLMTLYLEPVYLHCRIPDFIGGIFLKIQTLYSIDIRYELCKFGCYRLIINLLKPNDIYIYVVPQR